MPPKGGIVPNTSAGGDSTFDGSELSPRARVTEDPSQNRLVCGSVNGLFETVLPTRSVSAASTV
jgi:hypothetical protein